MNSTPNTNLSKVLNSIKIVLSFSKNAYPLKTKKTNRICEILVALFFSESVQSILQSENVRECVFKLIRNLFPKLGIKLIKDSRYSPTTQGQVERLTEHSNVYLEIQI